MSKRIMVITNGGFHNQLFGLVDTKLLGEVQFIKLSDWLQNPTFEPHTSIAFVDVSIETIDSIQKALLNTHARLPIIAVIDENTGKGSASGLFSEVVPRSELTPYWVNELIKRHSADQVSLHGRASISGFFNITTSFLDRFINPGNSGELRETMGEYIASIATYLTVDRAYIFLYDEEKGTMVNEYSWAVSDSMASVRETFEPGDESTFSGSLKLLGEKGLLSFDRVSELTGELSGLRREIQQKGVQSVLSSTLKIKGSMVGFIGFDTISYERAWSPTDKSIVSTGAQIISNVLERHQSMADVYSSEEKFRTLTEKAHAAIFITLGYRFVYANPEAIVLTGYSEDELLTQNLIEMLDTNEHDSALESGSKIISDQNYNARNERKIRTKSGEVKYLDITSNHIKYNDQDAIISIAFDVTEKHKKREEEKRLIAQLIQQNIDLEHFAYITSHNLRSPVAGIKGLISLIDRDDIGSKMNRDAVERIEKSTRDLENIIHDLNHIVTTRNRSGHKYQSIDLKELAKEVIEAQWELLKKHKGTIETDFSNAPVIQSVKSYLFSILSNLISNAIKYRKPGESPKVKITSFSTEEHWLITVEDNGLGIDLEKYKDRLFRFRQRFHKNVEGRGTGLYLVKTQVQTLGGSVDVESTPGKGSKFIVSLNNNH